MWNNLCEKSEITINDLEEDEVKNGMLKCAVDSRVNRFISDNCNEEVRLILLDTDSCP